MQSTNSDHCFSSNTACSHCLGRQYFLLGPHAVLHRSALSPQSTVRPNVCAIMNPPESETMGRTVTFQDGSTGMRERRCSQRGRTRCVRPYSLPAAGVHATSLTACRRSRVDGSMRARLSVALLENQCGASRAESGGAAHDPSTHDTRPGPLPAFLPLPLALFLPLPVPRPVTLVISNERAAPLMSLPQFPDGRPFLGHSFTPCCVLG